MILRATTFYTAGMCETPAPEWRRVKRFWRPRAASRLTTRQVEWYLYQRLSCSTGHPFGSSIEPLFNLPVAASLVGFQMPFFHCETFLQHGPHMVSLSEPGHALHAHTSSYSTGASPDFLRPLRGPRLNHQLYVAIPGTGQPHIVVPSQMTFSRRCYRFSAASAPPKRAGTLGRHPNFLEIIGYGTDVLNYSPASAAPAEPSAPPTPMSVAAPF